MKKHSIFAKISLALLVCGFAAASCKQGNNGASDLAERDSVRISKAQIMEMQRLNDIVTEIAVGLDSITAQEHMLASNKTKDGLLLSKEQVKSNLDFLAELLRRQRGKIESLQDSLSTQKKGSLSNMRSIIAYLNKQLEEKDEQIRKLKDDIENRNKDISELRSSLAATNDRADRAERKSEKLAETVSAMDEIANECFVKVGTGKELHDSGIVKRKFLSAKKVNYDKIDKSKFSTVDARKFRQMVLKSDNPKVLTPQPHGSYTISKSGKGTSVLRVTNPAGFWSVCNILIIQI